MNDGRLRSGHQPLDEVLGGGLPGNGISIIMGLPGTGKTIIAQQYTFHNARPDRPAVYFSTLSEPLEKIVRFGQTLDFFDAAAVGKSVFYEDLGQVASRDGLRRRRSIMSPRCSRSGVPGWWSSTASRPCACWPTVTRDSASSCTSWPAA